MTNMPLKRQFRLWTVLLVVVPSLLIMAIYTAGQIKAAKQESLEIIRQQVGFEKRLIEYWLEERIQNIREISASEALRTEDEALIRRELFQKLKHDSTFDSFSFIDKEGIFKVSTLSSGIKFSVAVGRPYYEAAKAGSEYISDVVIGRNSGHVIINLAVPVYDRAGQFSGLILGSIRTVTMEKLIHENWIGQTGQIFLVNRQGVLITEPRNSARLAEKGLVSGQVRMNLKLSADASRNIILGESGTAEWTDYLGNRVLGAYLDAPERNWTIIGRIDEAEILGPIYAQLAMMAGGTFVLLLLILPLAALLTDRIKRPIDWLIGQSNLVAAENYAQVGRDERLNKMPRELGLLCDTFVAMNSKIGATIGLLKENEVKLAGKVAEIQDINAALAAEITERQAAQAALTELNAELETKVAERTSELQDINTALEKEVEERQAAEKTLRQHRDELAVSEERYRSLFENMFHGFAYHRMIFDDEEPQDYVFLMVNNAFGQLTGLMDVVGRKMTEVVPEIKKANPELFEIFGRVARTGRPETLEFYAEPLNGWYLVSAYSTSPGYFVTVFDNITDRKRAEEDIRYMAYCDALTGLPNRAHLNERLEAEMEKARLDAGAGAVLFIDMDDVKMVNDSFGHAYGDALIINAGNRIAEEAGDAAFVGRIGGDEFMVMLPGQHDRRRVSAIADRIIDAFQQDFHAHGIRFPISASAGIALYPDDGDSAGEIFKNADNAMYAAKKAGKNCWRFYEPSMQTEAYDKILLTNSLRYAVERGELTLHYQPQVGLADGITVGFEALLRWNSPDHGPIPPARFIPLAEQSGLIQHIGRWVLREACQFVRRLGEQGWDNIHVAVNISPHQLCADGFVDTVGKVLRDSGIEPDRLELEITENALIASMEESTRKLGELREMGVRLSLDDFGKGYSSLTYLQRLPVKTLKIDKAFIDMILTDGVQKAIIGSIVDMAHVMEMTVVAEGVETRQQIEYLTKCRCDLLQGYIISRPVPEADAVRFLSAR
ncbi:MAG: EAL domain-containing protein [Negativicutes bacterium]|nr:EAL domain-containing protein [Negativicutes bacterium]